MSVMSSKQRADGWWYPWIFVAAFVVVFAVNGTMAYIAVSSWTGLENKHAFESGQAYNDTLAQVKRQDEMGWQEALSFTSKPTQDFPHAGVVTLHFKDKDGRPIDGLTINAQAMRPTVEGFDQTFIFTAQGGGAYTADVNLPLPGNWEIRYIATRADDLYKMRQRIVVR